jgi:hypothetical protein
LSQAMGLKTWSHQPASHSRHFSRSAAGGKFARISLRSVISAAQISPLSPRTGTRRGIAGRRGPKGSLPIPDGHAVPVLSGSACLDDRTRFSGVTPPAGWMILPRMDERVIQSRHVVHVGRKRRSVRAFATAAAPEADPTEAQR